MKYLHVKKTDIAATLAHISRSQSKAGIFHNVAVLPYRGRKYNPAMYVTVKIG